MSTMAVAYWNRSRVEVFVAPGGEVRRCDAAVGTYVGQETGVQSRAIGLREMDLNPQEAAALARMLDDPTVRAHSGAPVEVGDPSLLFQRAR